MGPFKKILTVAAVLALVVSAAGPAVGAGKPVVKIGFIGPLTGPNAALGLGARNSAMLAVKQANQRPNAPYKYKLIVMDDASDPSVGVAAATRLTTIDKVVAATTHFNSPVGLATIHVFHRYKTPQVFWAAIHPDITYKYNYPEVTRVCANTIVEHAQLANFAVKKLGYKKWVIIHDTTSYGSSCAKAAKNALKKAGAKIMSVDGVPVGTQDFRPILSRIKNLKVAPQAIYFGGVVNEAALLRRQMAEMGIKDVLFAGVSGFDSQTFNKTAGKAAEGTLIIGKKVIAKDSAFAKAYKKAGFREYYETTGPFAYDATNLIIAAIEKVGYKNKRALAKAIRAIKYNGVLGQTRFDKFGQTETGGLTLKISQDGDWVAWVNSAYAKGSRKLPKK
jgi:branched-chain amino acid transport system substrate-binding protein